MKGIMKWRGYFWDSVFIFLEKRYSSDKCTVFLSHKNNCEPDDILSIFLILERFSACYSCKGYSYKNCVLGQCCRSISRYCIIYVKVIQKIIYHFFHDCKSWKEMWKIKKIWKITVFPYIKGCTDHLYPIIHYHHYHHYHYHFCYGQIQKVTK